MNDYKRIKKVIEEQNFRSLRELAIKLDIKPQIFYDIKSGKCGISEDIATKIHDSFLNYSVAWLLGLDENTSVMKVGESELSQLFRIIEEHDIRFHDLANRILDGMGVPQSKDKKEKLA